MNPEWLPDWWIQSSVYEWMAGPGSWFLPLYLHVTSLVLEVAAIDRVSLTKPEHAGRLRYALVVLLCLHFLTWAGTGSMLDGGNLYYYWSGLWALIALLMGLSALITTRRALRLHAQAGRIAANGETHESRMPGSH